jgi:hypothetical protein
VRLAKTSEVSRDPAHFIRFLSLDLVEAFSVNALNQALRDECLMIDLLHHTEDGNGFRFLDKQYDDLDRLL